MNRSSSCSNTINDTPQFCPLVTFLHYTTPASMTLYERIPMLRPALLVGLAICLLTSVSCHPAPAAPASVNVNSPTPTAGPTLIPPGPQIALTPTAVITTSQSPCDHPYLPLHDGAVWHYRLIAGDGSQQEIAMQSHITIDGVAVTFGSDTSVLNCVDGALIGLLPGMIGSGHPDLGGEIIGNNPVG